MERQKSLRQSSLPASYLPEQQMGVCHPHAMPLVYVATPELKSWQPRHVSRILVAKIDRGAKAEGAKG